VEGKSNKTKSYIYGIVRIDKEIATADATVHAAHGQKETKGEEVTMIVMTNTVVKPSWTYRIKEPTTQKGKT